MTTITGRTLPATGRVVPAEPQYVLSKLQQMTTSDGIAYSAVVRVGRREVGMIENHGDGGGTWFAAATAADRDRWAQYERDYTELNPQPADEGPDPEAWTFIPDPADALFNEADLRRRFDRYVRRGCVVVRRAGLSQQEWEDDGFAYGTSKAVSGQTWEQAVAVAKRGRDADQYETYLPSGGWVPLREA